MLSVQILDRSHHDLPAVLAGIKHRGGATIEFQPALLAGVRLTAVLLLRNREGRTHDVAPVLECRGLRCRGLRCNGSRGWCELRRRLSGNRLAWRSLTGFPGRCRAHGAEVVRSEPDNFVRARGEHFFDNRLRYSE